MLYMVGGNSLGNTEQMTYIVKDVMKIQTYIVIWKIEKKFTFLIC